MSFFTSLKKKISFNHVSTEVDLVILEKAQTLLKNKKVSHSSQSEKSPWIFSLSSMAVACLVIILFSQIEKQAAIQQEVAKMETVIDPTSIEFIKHHEEIELMTESAEWSEEEWAIALDKQPSENS